MRKIACLLVWTFVSLSPLVGNSIAQRCSQFRSPMKIPMKKSDFQYITFPELNSPYKKNQVCEWQFDAVDDNCVISMTLVKSSIEGRDVRNECNKDYVNVFDVIDNSEVFLGRFCGRDEGMKFTSTGPRMIIRFRSDSAYEYDGFEAGFVAVLSEDSSDDDEEAKSWIQLAVSIPISFLILIVVGVIFVFYCRHQRRKAADRRAFQHRANERVPQPRSSSATRGGTSTAPSLDTRPFVRPEVPLPPYSRSGASDAPLQVVMPPIGAPTVQSQYVDRCQTPPPAYDAVAFTNQYSDLGNVPVTPPPYEEVVKESEESAHRGY